MKGALILVLGGGLTAVRTIERLRAAGFRTLVLDRTPAAPGFSVADAGQATDIADREAVLRAAEVAAIDGILPLNEIGVRTAAFVATRLGLVGNDERCAELSHDKGLMRCRWAEAGLAQPPFRHVSSVNDVRAAGSSLGYPLVLKPRMSGGGGRGVSIVRSETDIEWSCELAMPYGGSRGLIAEQFVEGTELTVESISYRGEVHVLAVSDKEKPPLRTRVARSLNYPAAIDANQLATVRKLVEAAVAALGIQNGPAHTEVIVNGNDVKLVETGARGGGGHIFSTIVAAVTGIDMVKETGRLLTGECPNLTVEWNRGCVYRFLLPSPGRITAVHGLEAALQIPGILDAGLFKGCGQTIGALLNSLERAGYVVATGNTREQAIERAVAAEHAIHFEIVPESFV